MISTRWTCKHLIGRQSKMSDFKKGYTVTLLRKCQPGKFSSSAVSFPLKKSRTKSKFFTWMTKSGEMKHRFPTKSLNTKARDCLCIKPFQRLKKMASSSIASAVLLTETKKSIQTSWQYWMYTVNDNHHTGLAHREKSWSQSSTFWHIQEKHGLYFLIRKLGILSGWLEPQMKLIGWVYMIILFHLAPSRMLYDKYFSHYDFLKFYL